MNYKSLNEDAIREASRTSRTGKEAAQKLGLGYKVYRRMATELGCYVKHPGLNTDRVNQKFVSLDARVLRGEVRKRVHGDVLLAYLLMKGLKEYKCEECGIHNWNGKEITLHVHHKDGDHLNNYIENLQILCPNCHSQTDTYCRRNKRRYLKSNTVKRIKKSGYKNEYVCQRCGEVVHLKIAREIKRYPLCKSCRHLVRMKKKRGGIPIPSKRQLENEVATTSYMELARKYHTTNTTIKRWCRKLGIPLEKRTNRQFG